MYQLQIAFAQQIASIVYQAYTSGVLQYHTMTIMGIDVELQVKPTNFNVLSLIDHNAQRMLSINIYDDDSEDAQFNTVQNLVNSFLTQ